MREVSGVKAQDLKIFMRQAEVTMLEKAVWCLILTWANKDGSNAYPTQETLHEISGLSESTIKRSIASLKKKGYLIVGKDRKKGAQHDHNVYTLKCRGHQRPPLGCHPRPITKSLYQNSDSLAVESEAILRVVPRVEEEQGQYGVYRKAE